VRVIVIVQARMTSSRLPGKVMLPLGDKTVLGQVLTRCRKIEGATAVCCAIPTGILHDVLAVESRHYGCEVFRGAEADVLERYWGAAQYMQADVVIRVTSDCPLISPRVCSQVLNAHVKEQAEYTCNNMPPSWPHGYDCEVFNFLVLEAAQRCAASSEDREHVTPWIRRQYPVLNVMNPNGNEYHRRITLDTPEDYSALLHIFKTQEKFS
jgi:spore coat polysaccharide biosynthesis protein SpsF